MITSFLVTMVAIGIKMLIIEKALLAFHSFWETCMSKKQQIVILSTYEVEYVHTISCVYHAI